MSWQLITPAANWSPRDSHGFTVFNDRMWILGGWAKEPDNFGDVWTSADGKHWQPDQQMVPWKARHAQSIYVHDNRLWIAGGHARPLDNQVWAAS